MHWRWAFTAGDNSTSATTDQKKTYRERNDLDTAIGEIMQYLGKTANGADSGNANVAVAPSKDTPSSLTTSSTFTLPEVTAGVVFTQVD